MRYRKALVVGVDYYDQMKGLHGCVNDAYSVASVLDRHADGTVNFSVKTIAANAENSKLTRGTLKEEVQELFEGENEIALLYFAGHGLVDSTGGYLVTSECDNGDDGLALNDILTFANRSKTQNKIIILDSCHSGVVCDRSTESGISELTDGLTVLTASTKDQYATEDRNGGVFTNLLVDALGGAGANLLGDVTPGSVYAHIDQSLGPWEQRPVFKTNVKSFVSMRHTQPPIDLQVLQRITELFPSPGHEFALDPGYEPESDAPDADKTEIFAILQKYNRVNLVVPVDAPHMYHAAMGSTGCKLTALGEHYRRLVQRNLI
ncbi:peptidase C14 caspase catalytic subunit p20 [Salinisphaera dokdonensis CL-ES53]|uniref:Peptidase C14 caspase catalytic subunit p20 n=1 Tax=Salinisphaera dokdonensis CL-ES53 TaxID=1304272 RepID=A0ABV2B4R0_9GAMM